MGSGTWEVKVGVFPAGPGPQTVPAAPQPRLSRRAGSLGHYRVFPEAPGWGEIGWSDSLPLSFHGGAGHAAELRQVLFPAPFGLGMAAPPAPTWTGQGGEDARFQRLAPRGRAEVDALAPRPSGVAVGGLGAPRAGSPAHPLLPTREHRGRPGRLPLGHTAQPEPPGPGRWEHADPSGAQCVETAERSCPQGLSAPAPILGAARPRTSPTTLGNSKNKCFPTFRESLHPRGVGCWPVAGSGHNATYAVARTMEMRGAWPIAHASGTSVCILKSEP